VALKATVFHTNQQKVVPVYAMQAFRGVDVQIHKHILSLSTTVNGHEWPASCQATPMPTEQETGWEQELAWGHFGVKKNLFPCQESNYDVSAVKPVAYLIYQLCCLSSV